MIEATGEAQVHAWRVGELPPSERLGRRIWSIPVPIPVSSLRYVLVYLLETRGGVVLVDAGWDTPAAWAALRAGITGAGHQVPDVRGVLVTHVHPDHHGLAGRVREASGAWVALHPAEAATLPGGDVGVEEWVAREAGWLRRCGVPEENVGGLGASPDDYFLLARMVRPDLLLEHGDPVPVAGWRLRALWTPGHTAGHLCFVDETARLLLSGDHILPRITPNVSAEPDGPPNPLGDFLGSLEALQDLQVDEVLPAHEYRFRGLGGRVDQLRRHHAARLREVRDVVIAQSGLPAWEIAQRLSWSRAWQDIHGYAQRAALGETLAHLSLLAHRGMVNSRGTMPGRWYPAPHRGPRSPSASLAGYQVQVEGGCSEP